MASLIEKMAKAGKLKDAAVLSKSEFFTASETIPTDLPILNVAFSGELDGGLVPGITIVAGQSKSFKTLLSLYCLKAYFDKYPDSICLFYDTEFGATPQYFKAYGIDPDRVLHIQPNDVEEMKFDIVSRLKEVDKKDKVFILVDSLGGLASKKEVEDAENEKSVADMSRAKAIRSMFRIITPHITKKEIPCVMINHVYQTMEMYAKNVVPGGTAVTYMANQIFIITKAQEKEKASDKEISGYKFTINIEKSRFVREKSKFPFVVTFEDGIQKWSSLFDLAVEAGFITVASSGWYNMVDLETGEIYDNKLRKAVIESDDDFFEELIKLDDFKDFIRKKFKLAASVEDQSQTEE